MVRMSQKSLNTILVVICRLCNKDRNQGQKGIGVIGIDHVVPYSIHRKNTVQCMKHPHVTLAPSFHPHPSTHPSSVRLGELI